VTSWITRRALLVAGAAGLAGVARAEASAPFAYSGQLIQGGWLIGRVGAGDPVEIDGTIRLRAGATGLFVVGFDRDQAEACRIVTPLGEASLAVAKGAFDIQRIDGLPKDQVSPTDPVLLARIAAETTLKKAAFAHEEPDESFVRGFILPVAHATRTSAFGPQRILNGEPKTPHYGVDLAAPAGTQIVAPADGRVVLANADLWFEGGLTLIDHGQGLVSAYLHQRAQSVREGQRVRQGEPIGEVGAKGRATGPHLCWRMTWRGRHMDPSLALKMGDPTVFG
jgi:murein DD-endopeptidase MepM/ murein hydrolase activator NlpD